MAYVGTSGFMYDFWFNIFGFESVYPTGTKKNKALEHYSTQFKFVELDCSYYRIPSEKACKEWYNQTPTDFQFLPKFPRSYTQYFKDINDVFPQFYTSFQHLKHKLLGVLLQFSPNFIYKDSNKERLKKAAIVFKEHNIQAYFEVRHQSWINEESYKFIEELGWVFVITHTPERGWWPELNVRTHPMKIMFRLHGAWSFCRGTYSEEFLQTIATSVADYNHVVISFNNVDTFIDQLIEGEILKVTLLPHGLKKTQISAVDNALTMRKLLEIKS